MENQSEISQSLDFQQVHILLSLIERERINQVHNFTWYPATADRKYYAQLMNIGTLLATVIHPDSQTKYLELFPDQYNYFGIDASEALKNRQAIIDKHKEAFPGQLIQEELPTIMADALAKELP